LGLEGEIGTVTPGQRADLVAVDGNPLQNITVLQDMKRIKLVLKGGDVCVNRRVE
jgi:imidazolonepropionase-like amidohydrolase